MLAAIVTGNVTGRSPNEIQTREDFRWSNANQQIGKLVKWLSLQVPRKRVVMSLRSCAKD
jgi:hypothetical protein